MSLLEVDKLHILINNAGIMMDPKFRLTEDGHEQHWQVNYLSKCLTPICLHQ